MGENSKIEWTDHTFNPWIGCQKVSPGCDHCYAESLMDTRYGKVQWGPHGERKRTSTANWKLPLRWAKAARDAGKRPRVFCASLADVFDNHAPTGARADLFNLIRATPELDWLLLTKRPENIAKMIPDANSWGRGWPNVWLGTTVENQTEADRRIPRLLNVPAKVHFVSCEPLLGPLHIGIWFLTAPSISWVIAGGESGPGARPMHPYWAMALRDQCAKENIPFLFKQWGEYGCMHNSRIGDSGIMVGSEMDDSVFPMMKMGKKRAGRILGGIEHNGFPEVSA